MGTLLGNRALPLLHLCSLLPLICAVCRLYRCLYTQLGNLYAAAACTQPGSLSNRFVFNCQCVYIVETFWPPSQALEVRPGIATKQIIGPDILFSSLIKHLIIPDIK